MAFLYGRTGRLAAENGGFRPGQCAASLVAIPLLSAASDGGWGRKRVLLLGLAV
jgi:hypothetical protein